MNKYLSATEVWTCLEYIIGVNFTFDCCRNHSIWLKSDFGVLNKENAVSRPSGKLVSKRVLVRKKRIPNWSCLTREFIYTMKFFCKEDPTINTPRMMGPDIFRRVALFYISFDTLHGSGVFFPVNPAQLDDIL